MNVRGLLAELEIEIVSEDHVNLNALCPLHDDTSQSWGMNKENGKWICRAGCGSGYPVQFIQRVLGCNHEQAKAKLLEYSDPKSEIRDLLAKKLDKHSNSSISDYHPPEIVLPSRIEFTSIPFPGPNCEHPAVNYAIKRMSFNTARYLGVCAAQSGRYENRIIIPIRMFNKTVGFIARAIDDSTEKRYLNATNILYSNLLFNYDSPIGDAGEVYLSESTFDCITLIEAHKPAMATFGARISYRQIELLLRKKVKKLIFCFHSDKAGDAGVQDKLKLLSRLFTVSRLQIPKNTDLNALGPLITSGLSVDTLIDDRLHRIQNSLQWKLEKS